MKWGPVALGATLVALLVAPAASAHDDFEGGDPFGNRNLSGAAAFGAYDYTRNMHPLGYSEKTGGTNSDLAFWGRTAYQGNYRGFRILDISSPAKPREILDYDECQGSQGDVVVWEDVLVRSWNSGASAGATCDGETVAAGFEGLHVFDVSNPGNPDLVAAIETDCGSHTASGVPDLDNGRLLIYNSSSSGACPGIDIVEVPLAAPEDSSYLRFESAGRACHDTGIILGSAMKAACAGGNGFTVWSLEDSLEDPAFAYTKSVPGVTIGHSAAFSWDGETLIFGHEPGGGSAARCTKTGTPFNSSGTVRQTDDMKSFFFYDAATGDASGKWTLPRDQTLTENCTLHNVNVVPTEKRDVLVHGSYQSGIGVLDFTDPANAREIAYADPEPLSDTQLILGGDWSSYWYDGLIYESDIVRGLLTWNLSSSAVAGAKKLRHLNPQTQEFTIE